MIKPGGYAIGMSNRYYREHGHGIVGAAYMTIPTPLLFVISMVLGLILGLVI